MLFKGDLKPSKTSLIQTRARMRCMNSLRANDFARELHDDADDACRLFKRTGARKANEGINGVLVFFFFRLKNPSGEYKSDLCKSYSNLFMRCYKEADDFCFSLNTRLDLHCALKFAAQQEAGSFSV